jgi:hypothetical protein
MSLNNGELLAAEDQALEGLESLLSLSESDLSAPIRTLIGAVEAELKLAFACVEKRTKKLKAALGRTDAQAGNALDQVVTRAKSHIQQHVTTNEIVLNQLAVKGGVIQVGDSLDDWTNPPSEPEPVVQWGGTLVLSVREAIPHLDQLIEVLKEIRDRLPGLAFELKGEVPSTERPELLPATLSLPKAVTDDTPIDDKEA